jgi:hypothetical protein
MLCLMAITILAYLVLGPERYITTFRGSYTTAARIMLSSGLGINGRLKQQRVLLLHLAACLSRHPVRIYWIGGAASWVVAALVDAADPLGTCRQSLPCLLDAVWRFVTASADGAAAGGAAGRIVQALSSCCSLQHLAGVALPGVLLCYIELRARRAWLPLEQQAAPQQTPSAATSTPAAAETPALPAAAAASSSGAAVCKGITDDASEQQQQQQQSVPPAPSSSSTATNTQLQQQQQRQVPRGQWQAARGATAYRAAAAAVVAQAASPLTAAAQRRLASCSMLYKSPVKSKVMSFKLRHPPTADGAGKRCMLQHCLLKALCACVCPSFWCCMLSRSKV